MFSLLIVLIIIGYLINILRLQREIKTQEIENHNYDEKEVPDNYYLDWTMTTKQNINDSQWQEFIKNYKDKNE